MPRILAMDVHYLDTSAQIAGITFADWGDAVPMSQHLAHAQDVASYQSGEFYKRELPLLLQLIQQHKLEPDVIVVDGYVFLDGVARAGLGKYLFDALANEVTIIGVAKNRFAGLSDDYAVWRGSSQRPLFVTSVGIAQAEAKEAIRRMHGAHRFPTLLKRVDSLARANQPTL